MGHSVRTHLRLDCAEYDRIIRQFIPGYEEMLAHAAEAVAAVKPARVLDLGAGTGGLTEQVLERTSDAVIELWDVDPEMLEQAGARLKRFGDRAVQRTRSYFDAFPECDAIMASLSLHHIEDMQKKRTLYVRAFEAIRPGGVMVVADATMPADPSERRPYFEAWAQHMVANGIAENRAWEHFEEWAEEDFYQPLPDETTALSEAGFEVSVPWRKAASTVMVAQRSA